MSYSVILSGPNHSGKSTLAGYIWSKDQNEKKLELLDERLRLEMGDEYDASRRFGYYVDTASPEKIKSPKKIGGSIQLHFRQISCDDGGTFLLIDSPGSNKTWKSRYFANHVGDIGVIVIEVGDFIKLPNKTYESRKFKEACKKILWPIDLWVKYKGTESLIIVISKMDGNKYDEKEYIKNDYDRFAFAKIMSIIGSDSRLNQVPIIPIAIDVKNGSDENVYAKSTKMPWYNGENLMDAIKDKKEKILSIPAEPTPYVFASIEKKFRVKETGESVVRTKIINGDLHVQDKVYLTQVSSSMKNPFKIGEAEIKSLKLEDGEVVKSFTKGDIGGVIFSKITIDGKMVKSVDLCLSRTSYIVDKGMSLKTGNLLFFKSQKSNWDYYDMRIQDKINILMFGKIVSTVLIAKKIENGYCHFCVFTNNYPVALPVLENQRLPFPKYVIEKANTDFMAVILCDLQHMSDDNTYIVKVDYQCMLEENIQVVEAQFREFQLIENTEAGFSLSLCEENIKRVMKKLRQFLKNNFTDEPSVEIIECS